MSRRYNSTIISRKIVAEETARDGNCFFECAARHLFGYALTDADLVLHIAIIRHLIVTYVKNNEAEFADFLNCQTDFSDFNTYGKWVEKMIERGIFADQTTVGAFTRCFGIDIHVWQQNSAISEVECTVWHSPYPEKRNDNCGIFLNILYIQENTEKKIKGHYEYVTHANGVTFHCGLMTIQDTNIGDMDTGDFIIQDGDVNMDTQDFGAGGGIEDELNGNTSGKWTMVQRETGKNKTLKKRKLPRDGVYKRSQEKRRDARAKARLESNDSIQNPKTNLQPIKQRAKLCFATELVDTRVSTFLGVTRNQDKWDAHFKGELISGSPFDTQIAAAYCYDSAVKATHGRNALTNFNNTHTRPAPKKRRTINAPEKDMSGSNSPTPASATIEQSSPQKDPVSKVLTKTVRGVSL
jgi:hypothetical protein